MNGSSQKACGIEEERGKQELYIASILADARDARLLRAADTALLLANITGREACPASAAQTALPAEIEERLFTSGVLQEYFKAPQLRTFLREALGDSLRADRSARAAEMGCRATWPGEKSYPDALMNLTSPPAPLFVQANGQGGDGALERLHTCTAQQRICVVGSRKPSPYGYRLAEDCARNLARRDYVLVSGLAYGIDSAAQRAQLDFGGITWAVLASGTDVCYPSAHRPLADAVLRQGCLLSEHAPGTRAIRNYFPARNRIMAALCGAVLVLEAAQRSGTWSTVEYGLELNLPIFAFPGTIYNPMSLGCNRLIASGAQGVVSFDELLEALGREGLSGLKQRSPARSGQAKPDDAGVSHSPCEPEDSIRHLLECEARSAEALMHALKLPAETVYAALANLQFTRQIRLLNGRYLPVHPV